MQKTSLALPSPVEQIVFDNSPFYLKHDERIHPDFSGNKARKFHYFLTHDFPKIRRVVSYGSAQSNAMYSLSILARMRGWVFDYYADHIAGYLRDHPHGNYARALANGMQLHTTPRPEILPPDTLLIHEGGRQSEAEYGVAILAKEITDWQQEQGIDHLDIFLPSGTGTTALYLQKTLLTSHFSLLTKVYTTPCVGDGSYLRKQFAMLEPDEKMWPTTLDLPRKYHFGKLYREFYEIWIELQQQTGVTFDLLYDPKGWLALLKHRDQMGQHLLYLHQGGLQGNESMLRRYERRFPNADKDTKR